MNDEYPHIVVEVLDFNEVSRLKAELECLSLALEAERDKVKTLERRYTQETYMNLELCDILRKNNINFRPLLSHSERVRRYGED